jgi:uncharacterized membrane protein
MPDIAALHPQVVHFVIAFLFAGVIARTLSLLPLPRPFAFLSPAATTLIVLGTIASFVAVESGDQAHGPAERVPGARDAVVEHEEWGERARNAFVIISLLELGALAGGAARWGRGLRLASAVAGLGGLFVLYEAAEHGGDVVYRYAGGVGLRSGDTADVHRLLVAGLYHRAMQQRDAGNPAEAARLLGELERQLPGDVTVSLIAIESRNLDQRDAAGALAALDSLPAPPDERTIVRAGMLRADLLEAMELRDSARATLRTLAERYPDNQRLRTRIERQ